MLGKLCTTVQTTGYILYPDITHSTTLDTTHSTTLGTTFSTINRFSSCTLSSNLMVDSNYKFCSTLASHHATDETNIDLPLPLSPYSNISLPFHCHCITGIEFKYHPLLYHNNPTWIKTFLQILQLLISIRTIIKGCTKERNKQS